MLLKKEEQGQPREVDNERDCSGLSWSASFPTKSSTFDVPGLGGTQKDDPGTNGSQSGVDFCTMIPWIKSSSLFNAKASNSPSDNDDDDDLEVEEVGSRSISISWASVENWRCETQAENGGDLRGSLRLRNRVWVRIRAIRYEKELWRDFRDFGFTFVQIYIDLELRLDMVRGK